MGKLDRQVYSLSGFIAGLNLNLQKCRLDESSEQRKLNLIKSLNDSLEELRILNLETENMEDN